MLFYKDVLFHKYIAYSNFSHYNYLEQFYLEHFSEGIIMLIIDFLASFNELYELRMSPVSRSFDLTSMELSILLFLANNPGYDTATEIVKKRHLTKSHVSVSVRDLEERGLIRKEHRNGDNRSVHLTLLPAADRIVREGQRAQKEFLSDVTDRFSPEEREHLQAFIERINRNVLDALQK